MPRTITREEQIFRYDELSDEAKNTVVLNDFDANWELEDILEELKELGATLLKESHFKNAVINKVFFNFTHTQGSGAVLEFDYSNNKLFVDFPEIATDLSNMMASDWDWRKAYELETEDTTEIMNLLQNADLSEIFTANLIVKQDGSRYANYEINYDVSCNANIFIRYCLYAMLNDWMFHNMKDAKSIAELESTFSSKAYQWYDDMMNIENYSNDYFGDQWFYADGNFAGYDEDFE